ncbi:MAG: 6-phosphofructokinase, partial [Synechococcales cyanobacterium]
GGADVILIPEIPYSIDNLYRKLAELHDRWQRRFAIVVVAEGARTAEGEMLIQENGKERFEMPRLGGMGQYIADQLSHYKGDRALETRVTVLGHIQRGGIPTALDRLMATAMGKNAVDLVAQGKFNHMVGWRASQVVTVPIEDVFNNSPALVDPHGFLVRTAHALGIYIGELEPDITSLPMATGAKV